MLDLVFSSDQGYVDQKVGSIQTVSFSWTDNFLVRFRLTEASVLGGGGVLIFVPTSVDLWIGMDFTSNMAGNSVESLTFLWNRKMGWTVDAFAPR